MSKHAFSAQHGSADEREPSANLIPGAVDGKLVLAFTSRSLLWLLAARGWQSVLGGSIPTICKPCRRS
jgi:hypothetical protein